MEDVALHTISKYFLALKEGGRGVLTAFAKEYKIPNWLITRIINGEGTYEPRRNYMTKILKGIIENPLDSVVLSDKFRLEVLKMASDDVDTALKFMTILSYKSEVNPTIFHSLMALIDILYPEAIQAKAKLKSNKAS